MTYTPKICAICKKKFTPTHPRQMFCGSLACLRAAHTERVKRYFSTHGQKDYHRRKKSK